MINLTLKKQPALLLFLFFALFVSLLSSCAKEADESLIKVASGPAGTDFSGGTGATGGSGAITFTLKGQSYTLKSNLPAYYVGATYAAANGSSVPVAMATISGISTTLTGNLFMLGAFEPKQGVCDISMISITLADGTTYSSTGSNPGKVTFNTFSNSGLKLTTQGTFESTLYSASDSETSIPVTGTFNL